MASPLIDEISAYCTAVSNYCNNRDTVVPIDRQIKNIFEWKTFQKEIGNQELDKKEFKADDYTPLFRTHLVHI